MFGVESFSSNDSLFYVPLYSLPDFHSHLILPRPEIPFHSEVHTRRSPIDVLVPQVTDPALAEEDTDEGWIVLFRPVPHREHQGILVVWWGITELQITVEGYPGVVESEAEEGKLEVQVLVDLRGGGLDFLLVIALVVGVATFIVVGVHEDVPDLSQSGFGDDVGVVGIASLV